MKKILILTLIALIGCSEYSENIQEYELTTPIWLRGDWINQDTQDVWRIQQTRIFRNDVEILGYTLDGMDYGSENGYFIEFPAENYFDNYYYYNGVVHDRVRLVFGNMHGNIESIYRVLNGDVEVYTDSIINKYRRTW